MINFHTGDILSANTDFIVIPINCENMFGAGLAKQFKQRFPEDYSSFMYKLFWDLIILVPGSIYTQNSFIFATTKGHWKFPSQMTWIVDILHSLKEKSGSIAFPPLGCGLGGLDPGEFCVLAKWFFAESKNSYELWDFK